MALVPTVATALLFVIALIAAPPRQIASARAGVSPPPVSPTQFVLAENQVPAFQGAVLLNARLLAVSGHSDVEPVLELCVAQSVTYSNGQTLPAFSRYTHAASRLGAEAVQASFPIEGPDQAEARAVVHLVGGGTWAAPGLGCSLKIEVQP